MVNVSGVLAMTALLFAQRRCLVGAWSLAEWTIMPTRRHSGWIGRPMGHLYGAARRNDASRIELRRPMIHLDPSLARLGMVSDESSIQFSTGASRDRYARGSVPRSTRGTPLSLAVSSQPEERSETKNLNAAPEFSPGTEIMVEIVSFGPMGASVHVIAMGHNVPDEELPPEDEPPLAKGLILQKEIHLFRLSRGNVDVNRGEVLSAYVERIRDVQGVVPKLDICLRAFGATAKASEASVLILARLNEMPMGAELPIGDKSPHDDIGYYFPGMSKTAFKRAVGNLFDQKKVWPSPYAIRLYTESDGLVGKKGKAPNKS